jgi:hypothetical protein
MENLLFGFVVAEYEVVVELVLAHRALTPRNSILPARDRGHLCGGVALRAWVFETETVKGVLFPYPYDVPACDRAGTAEGPTAAGAFDYTVVKTLEDEPTGHFGPL